MLAALRIRNFALIDEADLKLEKGFTVLTGETGSGKSILLGALNLVLGDRADFSVIGMYGEKAIVEADFVLNTHQKSTFFHRNDIDDLPTTIVRREITSQGRSRAFINDTPVQLSVLKEFTEQLIHIHSQYHTLELKKSSFQIELLDTLASLESNVLDFSSLYTEWLLGKKELQQKKDELSKMLQLVDYNLFQLNELEELNLNKLDYLAIEKELSTAENAEDIVLAFDAIVDVIGREEGVLSVLNRLKSQLDKNKDKHDGIGELFDRLKSVSLELKDIENEAENQKEKIEISPERKIELQNTIDRYYRVQKKHNATTQNDLQNLQQELSKGVQIGENLEIEIRELELNTLKREQLLKEKAYDLHRIRQNKQGEIAIEIEQLLQELKMPFAKVSFQVTERSEFNEKGISDVVLLFTPNKGLDPVSIDKAASGGELSRFMLAVQNLISDKRQLPTLLLDEIDTGVSGDVAQKIGNVLRRMGANMQLIAITHLPQVAGKAQYHFKVEKEFGNQGTSTKVREIYGEERIVEIARLMSGEEISDAALSNAKALML